MQNGPFHSMILQKNHSDIVRAGWRKSKIEVFNSEQGIETDPFL